MRGTVDAANCPVSLVGDAQRIDDNASDCYRLTESVNNASGALWSKNKIDLNKSFTISFDAYFGNSDSGADGIAFGFQQAGTAAIGNNGQGLGFAGITPSVGVEFDTYNNNGNDKTYDHTGIFLNGNVNNPVSGTVAQAGTNTNIEDGKYHNIKIVWTKEQGKQDKLEVYFDGVFRTSYTGNIITGIFKNDPNVYYGMTASTGGSVNEHRVCSINLNLAPVAQDLSATVVTHISSSALTSLAATDEDGTIASFTIKQLPAAGILTIGGVPAVVGTAYQWSNRDKLAYRPADGARASTQTFTYSVTDNNGLEDASPATYTIQVVEDRDQDGIVDADDLDADNDGIPNSMEGTGDQDGDGLPNYLDLDADGDGISDTIEGYGGTLPPSAYYNATLGKLTGNVGKNGLMNYLENGADSGVLIDYSMLGAHVLKDFDGDGLKDYLDIDSDNDGVTDGQEAQVVESISRRKASGQDADKDGIDDAFDASCGCNNNGIALLPVDSDRDGRPDYRDRDSDDDLMPDEFEAHDYNLSGASLDDLLALAETVRKKRSGGKRNYYPIGNSNISKQWLQDADNNGISDYLQYGNIYYFDSDGDGLVDLFDDNILGEEIDANPAYRNSGYITPLPVTLLYFKAQLQQRQVLLTWATATEENNAYFALERSTDGKQFTEIGRMAGAGNSNVQLNYRFLDAKAPVGRVYYRLKQVDHDGTATYSKLADVNLLLGEAILKPYPNPTTGTLYLDLRNYTEDTYLVQLFEAGGKIILEQRLNGGATHTLDLSGVVQGVYILRLTGNQGTQSTKVIKR